MPIKESPVETCSRDGRLQGEKTCLEFFNANERLYLMHIASPLSGLLPFLVVVSFLNPVFESYLSFITLVFNSYSAHCCIGCAE